MLSKILGAIGAHRLIWMQEAGIGFFDVDEYLKDNGLASPYDADYFDRYRAMATDPIGETLNEFRADLIAALGEGNAAVMTVLDVGIGDGAFIRALEGLKTPLMIYGADVNPKAIEQLEATNQLGSLSDGYDLVTFWDSLEHMRDPRPALRAANRLAVVSIPIFTSAAHAVSSKHFRPTEHFWYFTRAGFVAFAAQEGFRVCDILATETAIGREDIETFVLRRV